MTITISLNFPYILYIIFHNFGIVIYDKATASKVKAGHPRPKPTKVVLRPRTTIPAIFVCQKSAQMSKIKNGGLDQYGAEPFEQQQFGTAGVEGLNLTDAYALRYVAFASRLVWLQIWT